MQAEGDIYDSFISEALQVGNLGTFEVCRGGRVPHVDPADCFLRIKEVHGGGLFGGGGQEAVDCGAAQRRSLDVLGVRDQQDG